MSLSRLAALLVAATLLVACGSKEHIRYKMTVEVETPEGLKSGSAVRESTYRTAPNVPMIGEDRGGVSVRGEAVAVDLPNDQTLFALLSSAKGDVDYAARIPDRFLDKGRGAGGAVTIWPSSAHRDVPLLVRFRDREDPKTLEVVNPADLQAVFGPGIRLKRITVQACRMCSVTSDIENRLPSFGTASGFAEWYRSLAWEDPRRVGRESFTRGMRE